MISAKSLTTRSLPNSQESLRFARSLRSKLGFSILEVTLALAFLLLFSVGVMDVFYRTIRGNYEVSLLHENRKAFEAIRAEIGTNAHQATDITWDQNSVTLTMTEPTGSIMYQVQNHTLMKNNGKGWYVVPDAVNVEDFMPDIVSNSNGKLLVLVVDFKNNEQTLHARCAFAIKNQSTF